MGEGGGTRAGPGTGAHGWRPTSCPSWTQVNGKMGATGDREAAVMAVTATVACYGNAYPWPCPIATPFTVEAKAERGQVTCLRPHSLPLYFQSHRSVCSRVKIMTPLLCWHLPSARHLACIISCRYRAALGREAV